MYVGIDYHKSYSVATLMDPTGRVLSQMRLSNDPSTLLAYAEALPKGTRIALEASGGWYYLYELLEDKELEIYLAHPLKTRTIAEARIKTDRIDSATLAHLLRARPLPTSYIPPRQIRDVREILRYRASLVSLRTSLKNRVRAILLKNGLEVPFSNVFGKKARRYIEDLPLRTCYREALKGYFLLAEVLEGLISELNQRIRDEVQRRPEVQLLMTIPGIGYYSALLIWSEIGEISGFPSARKLCSYAGLVPSVRSSGGRTRYGPITKQGSRWLRWILIELSHHFVKGSRRL